MKKEEDKRLIIPKDAFEEEASEGLGKLNREEAEEDLRELRSRMERRVKRPRMIWLPAAAAVAVLLVASAVYIALFRNRNVTEPELAMTEVSVTDTAMIAMAEPIRKTELAYRSRVATPDPGVVVTKTTNEPPEAGTAYDMIAEDTDEVVTVLAAVREEEAAEEVVVEAIPRMEKMAMSDKKEKAADVAAAAPNLGVGMPDRQASPVGGMTEFNEWINRNIRYPEDISPRIRQVVIVTFKVAADSTVYDLKAERLADDRFTSEVFRLLRKGPKWEPVVRDGRVVPEEVRVSVVFK